MKKLLKQRQNPKLLTFEKLKDIKQVNNQNKDENPKEEFSDKASNGPLELFETNSARLRRELLERSTEKVMVVTNEPQTIGE